MLRVVTYFLVLVTLSPASWAQANTSALNPTAAPSSVERLMARPVDLGRAAIIEGNAPVSVTVALKLRNTDEMESRLQATYTEGSPQFHQFLSTEQFSAQYGPTAETIARLTRHFQQAGFDVTRTAMAHLRVTGSVAAMEAEFGVELHTFDVPTTASSASYRFRSPARTPQVSPAITEVVQAVIGLDTRPRYRSQLVKSAPQHANGYLASVTSSATGTANPPGALTVLDFAKYYDVEPLYRHGLNGRGTTLGIVTLASFTPSDAFAYWSALGLTVSPNRITEIQIDGGSGPPSDASGSGETTIDVEQAGGLAPAANIRVYEAPNTAQGFVDAFAAAIDRNRADTISCSWGDWEWGFQFGTYYPQVTLDGSTVTLNKAFADLFAQAALQGQSMYTVSADDGAYSSVYDFPPPSFPLPPNSVVVSAFSPASQRWTTAMGGTTLPGTITLPISATQNFSVTIASEQAWGFDYLLPWCTALGLNPLSCGGGIFPGGGGGGVSAYVGLPIYQVGIPGIQRTAPGQTLLDYTQTPPALVVTLPAGFLGRNVPDISLNSDPLTGYVAYYTSDVTGFGILNQLGGTSFAAPQFNGVTALYDQAYGRVGLLNFGLYNLVRRGIAYAGPAAPLRDIKAGDNWYYHSHAGYDQATGLGVPDFWNLFRALEPR
jgi:kumamolisin